MMLVRSIRPLAGVGVLLALVAILAAPSPVEAGGSRGKTLNRAVYKGKGSFGMDVKLRNPKAAAALGRSRHEGPTDFSYAIVRDHQQTRLLIKMNRPGEPSWSQTFVVKSEQTGPDGVRTITYAHASPRSALARDNRAALNTWFLRPFGGYRSLQGGGTLKIDGNRVTWSNTGDGKMRLGFVTRDVSWDGSFEGEFVSIVPDPR